jgi:hypothetical protein
MRTFATKRSNSWRKIPTTSIPPTSDLLAVFFARFDSINVFLTLLLTLLWYTWTDRSLCSSYSHTQSPATTSSSARLPLHVVSFHKIHWRDSMYQQPPSNQNVPTYTPPEQPYSQYPQPPPQDYPSYPPPPYQQPPQPKRKRRIWLWIVGAIIALIVISAAFSKPTTQTSTPPAATEQPTFPPLPTLAPTDTDTPVPTQPPTWTTVQTFKGNGNKKTGTFTVPDSWRITWSCDPSSFYGGSYNVIVAIYASDSTPIDPAAINTICQTGNTHDLTEEHQGGDIYLDVTSEGSWVIKIQALQ